MPMTSPPRAPSVSAAVAIQQLLSKLSLPGEPIAVLEGDAPEFVLRCLEQMGIYGRMVSIARLDSRELGSIDLPTLVRLGENRWILVVGLSRHSIRAEDADGKPYVVTRQHLSTTGEGMVLDRVPPPPAGNSLWSRVLRLVLKYPQVLWQLGLLALMAQGLSLLMPQLVRILVDRAFPEENTSLLQMIVLGMFFVSIFHSWIGWLERRLSLRLQVRLDAILERGMLVHMLQLPYRFLERKTIGQLMQAFQGFATTLELLTSEALAALMGGITAVAFLAMMLQLMAVPTVVVALIGIATLSITVLVGRQQENVESEHVESLVRERGYAKELLTHIAMLKAAGAERRSVQRWLALLTQERRIGLRGERIALGYHVVVDLIGQFQLQGLWIWGGLRVLDGSLQLGELLAFTLMTSAFHVAVASLGSALVKIVTAKPQLREAESLLAEKPLPTVLNRPPVDASRRIEIRDLWFRYRPDLPWVIAGLNLVVAPGMTYRLEGRSGFGKTTLLKIMAGLYEPERGSVRIGGQTPAEARQLMIYLPQFVRLFNASILENLRLFSGGATYDKLIAAAELSGLAALVAGLPMGYDTLLAQDGANFSGGQRQLIALTAVLASSRPILLLDEAMSNMDALRRKELRQSPLLHGRTIVYTSHDDQSMATGEAAEMQYLPSPSHDPD